MGKPTPFSFVVMDVHQNSLVVDVTGVLLAGGKSRRMGEDKRYLSIEGQSLLERSAAALRAVFRTVFVIIAQDSPPLTMEVPVFRDMIADRGSLGGLYTGLKQSKTGHVFVVACDMPFLDPGTMRWFAGLKDGFDVVMARLENRLHPMHALYSQRCVPVLEEMVVRRDLKIQRLLGNPSLAVRIVEEKELKDLAPDARGFFNVNTPADLEAARLLARSDDSSTAGRG
ncbi:MAG TPA: molybdenum cofactor guanylyltransferase [Nitrospira sp.]|nr:molybdenum cofactor guanylyltransferase [Nitrospira sp.]